MDWKYKRFHQERVFPAPREVVFEAARAFMGESLGWQVRNTPEGFTAEGYSFTHRAIANFRIQSPSSGSSSERETSLVIELLVERAGGRGYMLFDVGGYYNIQVRKWLDGVEWVLRQKLTGVVDEATNPLVLAEKKPAAYIFNGCLMFIFATVVFYFLLTFISALVGLLTGSLFLLGRNALTIHGTWARILSALILMFGVSLAWRIKREQ